MWLFTPPRRLLFSLFQWHPRPVSKSHYNSHVSQSSHTSCSWGRKTHFCGEWVCISRVIAPSEPIQCSAGQKTFSVTDKEKLPYVWMILLCMLLHDYQVVDTYESWQLARGDRVHSLHTRQAMKQSKWILSFDILIELDRFLKKELIRLHGKS